MNNPADFMTALEREQEDLDLYDFLSISSNKFIKYRKQYKTTWMKLDGTIVKIKDMSTNHILNAMELLERIEQTDYKAYRGLLEESERRAYAVPKM